MTRKLLSNVNQICRPKISDYRRARTGTPFIQKRGLNDFRRGTGPARRGGPRFPLNSVISALLIAIILLIVGLREGIRGCRADFLIRESQSV